MEKEKASVRGVVKMSSAVAQEVADPVVNVGAEPVWREE
jgi:hypothetical protein